jgi:hypothetical protein
MHFSLDISLGQATIASSIVGAVIYLHRTLNGIGLLVWQHRVMWDHHRRHYPIPEFPSVTDPKKH